MSASCFRGKETSVVVGGMAGGVERLAARELADILSAIAGARIPVVEPPARARGKELRLLVGQAALAAAGVAVAERGPALDEDEIEVRRLDANSVLLRGGGPRGALYAAYEWLDRLGCRWYHPEETFVPRRQALELPKDFRVRPGFEYREVHWFTAHSDPAWACRNRLNGHHHRIGEDRGGVWRWEPYVHSFHRMVPPDKYAVKHPEYFSFRRGQGCLPHGAQLCLSNPDVFGIVTDAVLGKMAEPGVRIVDVSQNDCANPCQCRACEAKDRKAGSHAGALLDFVNRVAEAICRHHPDKYVGTLAYTYTQSPPKAMAAHDNVIVRLCHMEPSCDVHPLASCEHNRWYVRCLEGWTRLAKRVYVWHYVTNFLHNLGFHPNLDALAEDVRYYRDAGVKGIFFQGNPPKGVSLEETHSYAQARLAWDPRRDYFAEAREFMGAFYGDAGPFVFDLVDALHGNAREGFHAHLYTHPAEGTFAPRQLEKARECLEKAWRAADGNAKVRKRLERVRLWLNYTRLTSIPPICPEDARPRVVGAPGAKELFAECRAGMKRLGISQIQEFPSDHQDLGEALSWSLVSRKIEHVALENEWLRVEMAPDLAGMAYSFRDKETGIDLFRKPEPWMLRYPYIGGYTEGPTRDGFGPGLMGAYRFAPRKGGGGKLVLEARLRGGIHVERAFRLDPDRPALLVESAYTNRGRKTAEIQPHRFVIVGLGKLDDIRFFRMDSKGKFARVDNSFPSDGTVSSAQWVSLRGENSPRGQWGCFDRRLRIGLLEDFGRDEAVACGSNAYLRDRRVLLETLLAPVRVAPGKSVSFRHCYEVIRKEPRGAAPSS